VDAVNVGEDVQLGDARVKEHLVLGEPIARVFKCRTVDGATFGRSRKALVD
jgi:hypothetical protein